jgi:pyruvate dehydrogenase E2 component (dihydrolipoamide acetyltransferase)
LAHLLIMPRQGNTVESCIIVRWRAAEGQSLSPADIVCEVETDKASFDVPAGVSGTLLKILHPAGDDVPVLQPIAVIGAPGEDWRAAAGGGPTSAGSEAGAGLDAAARARAQEAPQVAGGISAEVKDGSARPRAERARVSPRARRLAASRGIDPETLAGTGPGGRVIERDVASAAAGMPVRGTAAAARVPVAPAPAAAPTAAPYSDAPIQGVRKLIAERMRASLASHAQLTLNASAPAARLLELRARFKASDPSLGLSEVTVGDLVLYAVSRVLPRFPAMNARLQGGVIRSYSRIHLGLAVDTPRGLMVPVIRGADGLSLMGLSAEAKRLAAACRAGTILPDELSGSTFSVTNLGGFGVESFTPVLNSPEVGILGVCSISQAPASGPNGAVILEPRLGLSLTFDHQAIDGAPAARFLEALSAAIADIDLHVVR